MLPLGYCTNVHAGLTVAAVEQGLDQFTVPIQQRVGRPIAAGLWLAAPVIQELLADPAGLTRFVQGLKRRDLVCYTLNAFPYGNFHDERVKEQVYLPDWTQPERLTYTQGCAEVLARLLPEGETGSISTVPLGFKGLADKPDFLANCVDQLLALAVTLRNLHQETGRLIRLAIEPEPCCVLETTAETRSFFELLFNVAEERSQGEVAREHLGVCYDVCHQSVEFEDVAASIRDLTAEGIRNNKLHITCALELREPAGHPEAREALAAFAEPRYLHQTFAWTREPSQDTIRHLVDLTPEFASQPPTEFLNADCWRIHFHAPVNAEALGPLTTTRADLITALKTLPELPYLPHLEVETYTWNVLPGAERPDLVSGIADELIATQKLLDEVGIG